MAAIPLPVLSSESAQRRETFFKVAFDRIEEGYICIARRIAGKGAFEERFFVWPDEQHNLSDYISQSVINNDVWFAPMVFDGPQRKKERVLICPSVWADLDTCDPGHLLVPASVCLESSTNRFQALWMLQEPAEPVDAEEVARRVAYFHESQGADKSGWDLTQLLRVPFTLNYKYSPPEVVSVRSASDSVTLEDFQVYPPVAEDANAMWAFPDEYPEADVVLEKYKNELDPRIWRIVRLVPEDDWSKQLWSLELLLCETGLERPEVFAVARSATCNKYRRDGRSDHMLWKEVCKAWNKVKERSNVIPEASVFKAPDLLSDADVRAVEADRTFLEDYIDWAKGVGDAAEAYHQAGAFTALSGVLAGTVQLPTSFGPIIPNLWFLLLADTTLTRKSTALDLSIEMLLDVQPNAILATDGSIEGLFGALSLRPGQPSVFLRDEFSGLLEMMSRRDYYSGMAETLTKLYDGKFQKRQLRREVIEVRDPVLLILAGGIRTKILSLLDDTHVTSGFLPRFILITAKSNLSKLQPLGPPSDRITTGRTELVKRLADIKAAYEREIEIKAGSARISVKDRPEVLLTPGAWELYNMMEMKMLESGIKSLAQDMLTPTMDRLSKSGLKAAVLIAASRLRDESRVEVNEGDIMKAFQYVIHWREYAMEVISNVGITKQERYIETIYGAIMRNPGIQRSTLMRNYHMTKRDADVTFDTLEQRGLITRTRSGASEKYTATI